MKKTRRKKRITKSLKKSACHKNVLCKKWIKTRNLEDKENYVKYRKVFEALANQAESDYYKQLFDTRTSSIKQLWTNLNSFCSLKPKRKLIFQSCALMAIRTNEVDICNASNTCFCNIGHDLVIKLQQTTKYCCNNNFTDNLSRSQKNAMVCD